jgi:hypothetical protein
MNMRVASSESAVSAGLRHVTDDMAGIIRRRRGAGFRYMTASGATIQLRVARLVGMAQTGGGL